MTTRRERRQSHAMRLASGSDRGRGRNQAQRLFAFGQHAAPQQGASRGRGRERVGHPDGHASSLFGTSHRATSLLAEDISGASRSDPAIEPAITPVHQTTAGDVPSIPRCVDQTLPTSSFSRPEAREGWVKGHLPLVLPREISTRHQREHVFPVGRKLIPPVSLDQIRNGERFGDGRTGETHRSPQAFSTSSACSSALRLSVHVERLQTES